MNNVTQQPPNAEIGHLHGIIDELQAVIRGMEQRMEADARRIAELEALVGRMDAMAAADSYAEQLSALAK